MRLYLEPHKIGDDVGSGWGVHICLGVEACFVGREMDVNLLTDHMQVRTTWGLNT